MRAPYYILNGHEVVGCSDAFEWGKWFEANKDARIVKQEYVRGNWISTVFLGLDHNYWGGSPVVFETMVFPSYTSRDLWCERCSTWEEAEAQHKKGVEWAKEHHNLLGDILYQIGIHEFVHKLLRKYNWWNLRRMMKYWKTSDQGMKSTEVSNGLGDVPNNTTSTTEEVCQGILEVSSGVGASTTPSSPSHQASPRPQAEGNGHNGGESV